MRANRRVGRYVAFYSWAYWRLYTWRSASETTVRLGGDALAVL